MPLRNVCSRKALTCVMKDVACNEFILQLLGLPGGGKTLTVIHSDFFKSFSPKTGVGGGGGLFRIYVSVITWR